MNAILKELSQLGTYEKLELIEELWNSIDADTNAAPMSDELYAELERRSKWSAENPGRGQSIGEIARELGVKL
ncbi:MAG TPA: addiction module protein [Burkholderiaceae bacterium]|nr:addiction module protein [Burkholderiaceae bacterium]